MIISIRFLEGCAKPTIALLYQEGEYRHVQTYAVNAKDKELSPGPWKESAVEQASNLLIAVPPGPPSAPLFGGIIVGESAIAYKSGTKSTRIPMNACTVICACYVDTNRILLGQSAFFPTPAFFFCSLGVWVCWCWCCCWWCCWWCCSGGGVVVVVEGFEMCGG